MSDFGLYAGHGENYSVETILFCKVFVFVSWGHFLAQIQLQTVIPPMYGISDLSSVLEALFTIYYQFVMITMVSGVGERFKLSFFKIQNSDSSLAVSFLR